MNCPNCQSVYNFPYNGEDGTERMCSACGRVFSTVSKSKYHVEIRGVYVDVYDILKAYNITNPADQHAVKKMLMPGQRGHKDGIKDREEAIQSLKRAIELESN